jgi:polysaccharide biosynthesis/export protein
MVRMSRRSGVASVVLLSMCVGLTGCLNTASEPPILGPNGYSQMQQRPAMYPPNQQMGMTPNGNIRPVSFTGQVMPGQGEEVMIDPNTGMQGQLMPPVNLPLPTELAKTTHAPHRVAAPDILLIEALRLVPKGPYRLEAMEVLQIEALDVLPKQDIKGLYMISPEGRVNLGFTYGSVVVGGLSVEAAQAAIRNHLAPITKGAPTVNVSLVQMRGMQNIKGEHLVRPDGTVSLGMYGSVFVAGMTLGQVKAVVENHLGAYLVNPQISVDVLAYNSRKIYIIADGAGYGQQVIALPATGNETVLDAIAKVNGLPAVASLKKIWVSRPSPTGTPCSTVLPVDWKAITQAGRTETNYQLLPGDRIYISANPLITIYNYIDMAVAPVERVLSVLWLASNAYWSFHSANNGAVVVR